MAETIFPINIAINIALYQRHVICAESHILLHEMPYHSLKMHVWSFKLQVFAGIFVSSILFSQLKSNYNYFIISAAYLNLLQLGAQFQRR